MGLSKAFVIAARRTNTLVLVHRAQLLDQWRERLAAFLDLPIDSIGQIGGMSFSPDRKKTRSFLNVQKQAAVKTVSAMSTINHSGAHGERRQALFAQSLHPGEFRFQTRAIGTGHG
jgi:superfamily II DNA or RNA helicase